MTFEAFIDSLKEETPPVLSDVLLSLWYDAKGDWERAHDLISEIENPQNNRMHAYLHRKEGDTGNAEYWYRKAGAQRPAISLEEEWENLVRELL